MTGFYCTCGFTGYHRTTPVFFISRYREIDDYCVNGRLVSVHDDGSVLGPVSAADARTLALYLLSEYREYCEWHAQNRAKHGEQLPPLSPFGDALYTTLLDIAAEKVAA